MESNFAINFLSRFALTKGLLPALTAAGQSGDAARIVIIGGVARNARIYFDDVNLTNNFGMLRVVSQFCRANDLFTGELSRRLAIDGINQHVTVTCLKIGVVKTNIRRDFPRWMKWMVPVVLDPLLGQTAQDAVEPALQLLLSKEFEGVAGALFLKRKFGPLLPDFAARDRAAGNQLWECASDYRALR